MPTGSDINAVAVCVKGGDEWVFARKTVKVEVGDFTIEQVANGIELRQGNKEPVVIPDRAVHAIINGVDYVHGVVVSQTSPFA